MTRRTPTLLLAAVLLTAATTAHTASAQSDTSGLDIIDNEIEDGSYTGTISLDGGFALTQNGAGFLITADIDGEAQIVAADGVVSGSWTYSGTGAATISGPGIDAQAAVTFTGEGTFGGTNLAARVLGNTDFSGAVEFQGNSVPFGDSAPTDEALTDVLAGCGQIVGTYTQRINESLEAEGADSFIRGVIALYSTPPTSEAVELAERASELRANPDVDIVDRLLDATGLLLEVQLLQADLNASSSCPSTKEYFNLLTNVAADLIADALAALEALEQEDPARAAALGPDAISLLVIMGVSTGATGAGAVGGRGADLLPAIRDRAQATVDLIVGTTFDIDALTELAVLSVQQNWNLTFDQISDRDVLNLVGADAEQSGNEQSGNDEGVGE